MSKVKLKVGEERIIGNNVLIRNRGFFVNAYKSNGIFVGMQNNIYADGSVKTYDMVLCSADSSLESLPKEVVSVLRQVVPSCQNWSKLRNALGGINA